MHLKAPSAFRLTLFAEKGFDRRSRVSVNAADTENPNCMRGSVPLHVISFSFSRFHELLPAGYFALCYTVT